uniref:Putative secreted salivary gland peptide n=2 Tax=Ixodes ricinus TaxID=34613 RepID=A0A090XBC2_IXORI
MSVSMIMMGLATFFHDAESLCQNWYLDETLSHMSKECKKDLESQFLKQCARIGGEFRKFEVCKIQCLVRSGNFVSNKYVKLRNGLPCGPYGEKCLQGSCYGPCEVQFFNPPKPRSDE